MSVDAVDAVDAVGSDCCLPLPLPLRSREPSAALCVPAAVLGSFPGPLPEDVAQRWGWSVDRVVGGAPWRALSAVFLTRDALMLSSLVVLTGLLLWALERVVGSLRAGLVFLGGAAWGHLGTTPLVVAPAATGWDTAERARQTLDYGPSGGTAAVAALLVVLRRARLTAAVTGALLLGSALHHQIADVEHLVGFGTVLLLAAGVRGVRARRHARAAHAAQAAQAAHAAHATQRGQARLA